MTNIKNDNILYNMQIQNPDNSLDPNESWVFTYDDFKDAGVYELSEVFNKINSWYYEFRNTLCNFFWRQVLFFWLNSE